MRAILSIVLMSTLGLAASAHAAGGMSSPAAHDTQADQVSVIKVEGMT